MNSISVISTESWENYQLLDSGEGEKLECISGYTIRRPDPRAIWHKHNPSLWNNADAWYDHTTNDKGIWHMKAPPPPAWTLQYQDLSFLLRPTDFKHIGIFPEQRANWDWIAQTVPKLHTKHILNLFGYTGAATVVACKAGADVTHVDSSKPSLTWAHDNCLYNHIHETKTRWILDDALKFVLREAKRGRQYDAVILDPPRFGRGAKGEVWKLEEDLPKLLTGIKNCIHTHNAFILLNVYTADFSALAIHNLMQSVFGNTNSTLATYELATREIDSNRLLPQGIVARWCIL